MGNGFRTLLLAGLLALTLPVGAHAASPKKSRALAQAAPACEGGELDPARDNLDQVADATLCLINLERVRRGRRALRANAKLARAGLRHAGDMVQHSYFAHISRDGTKFGDRIRATGYLEGVSDWLIGENLAWGTGVLATPREIVRAWMKSPGHKDNILEPEYREVGLAVLLGNPSRSNGLGATYATEFGVKRSRSRR